MPVQGTTSIALIAEEPSRPQPGNWEIRENGRARLADVACNVSVLPPVAFALSGPILLSNTTEPYHALSAVIVDDEQLARDELAFLLKSTGEVDVIAHGENGVEAVNLIREHNPDMVFLDVQMPRPRRLWRNKKLLDEKFSCRIQIFDRLRSVCREGVRSECGRLPAQAF